MGQIHLHLGYISVPGCDSLPSGAGPQVRCLPVPPPLHTALQLPSPWGGSLTAQSSSALLSTPRSPRPWQRRWLEYPSGRQQLKVLAPNQKAVKYLGQDFETLRQKYLDSRVLVKDPEFPVCPPALDYEDLGPCSPQTQGVVWKRPVVRRWVCC